MNGLGFDITGAGAIGSAIASIYSTATEKDRAKVLAKIEQQRQIFEREERERKMRYLTMALIGGGAFIIAAMFIRSATRD